MRGTAQKAHYKDCGVHRPMLLKRLPSKCSREHSDKNLACAFYYQRHHTGRSYHLAYPQTPERFGKMVRKERSGP